ncbi:unnamed protein product [Calypogeia fissa]
MAATEVATVSNAVIQIATAIQGLGNNWYKVSADWVDFPRKIAKLERKRDFWIKQFRKSNMSSESSPMVTLREAEDLLNQERTKLERRQARCGSGCWSRVCMTMFPAQVGLKIQLVIEAFDAILGDLQLEENGAAAVERRMIRNAASLAICDDNRYVTLKATESKIQTALDNLQGSQVVLLHGAPGKGKTTLAVHVGLHYQSICKNPEAPFEQVVFLECGPSADTRTTQLKLAQLLGSGTETAVLPEENAQIGFDVAIHKQLLALLKNQRILLIIDDVWEQKFLQEMLNLCGVGVKCLVTSQNGELCRGLTLRQPPIPIQIEDIQVDVAMEILASHVGFTNKQIPVHIQGVAHKMIKGTEGNPLALASVARAIDWERVDELVEWEAASQDFLTLLQSDVTTFTLGMPYSKSFWTTTKLSIHSLKKDARKLLVLLYLCEAPSVPEEVLNLLYRSAVFSDGSETFEMSRAALKNRGLVMIRSQSLDNHRKEYSWSLHSLHKSFIEKEMKEEKVAMLEVLGRTSHGTNVEAGLEMKNTSEFSVEDDSRVRISLCALYFNKQHTRELALQMGFIPNELKTLRRNVIEPITRLLAQPVSDRWTKSAQSSAQQVYLEYVYNSALHQNGILDLLALPISTLPTLQAMKDITVVESKATLIDENSSALVKAMVNFLGNLSDKDDTTIATAAGHVFLELAHNILHHAVIISSGIVDTIVRVLASDSYQGLLVVSTNILIQLTYNNPKNSVEISKHPRILDVLVKLLFDKHNPYVPVAAVMALDNLAVEVMEFAAAAINYPRVLEQLANLLSKNDNPDLQIQVTQLFGVLGPHAQETVQNVFDYPSALEFLLKFMSKDGSRDLQERAARGLRNLTSIMTPDMKGKFVGYPGALEKLFASLLRDDSPQVQVQAAYAFFNLAVSDEDIIVRQLLNFPGLMEQLVNLLSQDNNVDLQDAAACTLHQLANRLVDETRLRMMHCSGLLEKFVSSLCDENHHRVTDLGCAFVEVLTLIDPARGNGAGLQSARAYARRGHANMQLGLNKEALEDLNRAIQIEPGNVRILRNRCTVRARLGDFQGALVDSNSIIEKQRTPFDLQESGVLKRMMGDLSGAMEDLNECDPEDYEIVKHKAFVRFLLKDEIGARVDAEKARSVKPSRVDSLGYGRDCLGTSSVEFLDYRLR